MNVSQEENSEPIVDILLYFYGHFHWYFALNNNNVPQDRNKKQVFVVTFTHIND